MAFLRWLVIALAVMAAAAGLASHAPKSPAAAAPAPAVASAPGIPAAAAPLKGNVTMVIENMKFHPSVLFIEPGTRVTIVNKDSQNHSIIGLAVEANKQPEQVFENPNFDKGTEFSVTFRVPAAVHLLCDFPGHMDAGMVGKVKVVAAKQ